MDAVWRARIAGGAAGIANGLFGGGGGMVFVPLMSHEKELSQRRLYATCVGVILPVCLVSSTVYFLRSQLPLTEALPYLAGGLCGGFLGGKLYGRIPTKLLKWSFAGFLLYAGVRYLV